MATPESAPVGAPELDAAGTPYPPYAVTAEDKRRWDYAIEAARQVFADDGMAGEGPTPSTAADILMAARAVYWGDIPTGDLPEAVRPGHPLAGQAAAGSEDRPTSGSIGGGEPLQTPQIPGEAGLDLETPGSAGDGGHGAAPGEPSPGGEAAA